MNLTRILIFFYQDYLEEARWKLISSFGDQYHQGYKYIYLKSMPKLDKQFKRMFGYLVPHFLYKMVLKYEQTECVVGRGRETWK